MKQPMGELASNSHTISQKAASSKRRGHRLQYSIAAAVLAGLALIAPAARSADELNIPGGPATRPADTLPSTPDRRDGPNPFPRNAQFGGGSGLRGLIGKPRQGLGMGPATQPSAARPPASWSEVEAFMQGASPAKFEMFQRMADNSLKQTVQAGIVKRYRDLQQMKDEDQDFYALELRRIAVEDAIFSALRDFHMAKAPEQKEKARLALRAAVSQEADNAQDERKFKIERLQRQIEAMKGQLDYLKGEFSRTDEGRDRYVRMKTDQILRTGLPADPRGQRRPQPPDDTQAFPSQ